MPDLSSPPPPLHVFSQGLDASPISPQSGLFDAGVLTPSARLSGRPHGLYYQGIAPARERVFTLVRRPTPGPVLASEEREFLDRVFASAGLALPSYRAKALLRRLPACLRYLGVSSLAQGIRKLSAQPALGERVLDIVLLGVTEFCRDGAVFSRLRTEILPRLCTRPEPVRIWSAACSDGQELYSVAVFAALAGTLDHCEFLGTDCRPSAVERAGYGVFSHETLAPLERALSGVGLGDERRLSTLLSAVRSRLRWRTASLLDAAEPGPWHLILCRNLAIYLEPGTARTLWQRLAAQLAPGGYLIVGKAEAPIGTPQLQLVSPCIYRKLDRSA